ncbi:MAG: keratin [Bacteroidia bacterium]|nr:keratin [Bacteroidia bacterium]
MASETKSNGAAHPPVNDPIDQLVAIKNIIFGTEMQELTRQIQSLTEAQQQSSAEHQARLEKLESDFAGDLKDLKQSLLSELNTRLDSIQADLDQVNESKTDRKQLGELLMKIGEQLVKG